MSMPTPPRPDSSVNPDSSFQLAEGFNVMVTRLGSLERVITQQTSMLERTINAQMRYQMAGQPQIRPEVLQSVASAGGLQRGYTGLTQTSTAGALTSMENLSSFTSQRIGQWLAGVPLYQQPGGQQAQGQQLGGTPIGMPNANAAPAGAGARAAAAAQAAAAAAAGGGGGGGGGPRPGPAGGGGGLGGLPGMIWGPGTRTNANPAVLASIQQFGARVAMSGGGLSGIGQAARRLPIIGLGMDLVAGGFGFYQRQRDAARGYQEVEGGSNLAAQAERFHAAAYSASMYGLMSPGAAADAFGQVTAMGYNRQAVGQAQQGQNRQSALDFIYHNYTGLGMNVDQSTQILQTASQNATVSLKGVSDALTSLSDTAGKAGANANQARNEFNQYFQTALGQGAGAGSPQLAGALAGTQASYGKQFAGLNFGGELSQNQQYMLAGKYGISPAQFQYLSRTNPQSISRAISGNNLDVIQQLMTPEMMTSLQQMIAQAGGGNAITPNTADQIAQQFLNQWQVQANINLDVWAQVISAQTGAPLNAGNVMSWIVNQVAGRNEASQAARMGSSNSGGSVSASNTGAAPTGQYGLAQPSSAGGSVSSRYTGGTSGTWQQTLISHSGAAAQAYLAHERSTNKRSPVLEGLLQNLNQGDQVQVSTKNGPRVMSLAQAMKFYPNELAQGNVQFYNAQGQPLGNTSAITHGLINTSANISGEEAQRSGSKQGLTWAKWKKEHPGSVSSGAGQSVTVHLSNEAKQLIKLLPSNNDAAAAASTVPENPYVSSASR